MLEISRRLFGSDSEARNWFVTNNPAIQNERLLQLLISVKGDEYVRNTLLQIEHGIF